MRRLHPGLSFALLSDDRFAHPPVGGLCVPNGLVAGEAQVQEEEKGQGGWKRKLKY